MIMDSFDYSRYSIGNTHTLAFIEAFHGVPSLQLHSALTVT